MMHLPLRHSLITETTNALRAQLAEGEGPDVLPSERVLCQQLHVSRPTLRLAMEPMENEGLIEVVPGKGWRIVRRPEAVRREGKKMLGMVVTQPIDRTPQISAQLILELRYHLLLGGIDSEFFVCVSGDFKKQQKRLEVFIEKHSLRCCMLMLSSHERQMWFVQKGFPAFVLGSPHPSVALPSLDIDYRAVCRHAAGILLGRGHRHIALVRVGWDVAGDKASEMGFGEGVKDSAQMDARCTIVRHSGKSSDLCSRLNLLFAKSDAPTALLVCDPTDVFVCLIHLLNQGISVPGKVSIVARDDDHAFDRVQPTIARYELPLEVFSQRLTRLTLQLVENGSLPSTRHLLVPRFVDGGTLGRAPKK